MTASATIGPGMNKMDEQIAQPQPQDQERRKKYNDMVTLNISKVIENMEYLKGDFLTKNEKIMCERSFLTGVLFQLRESKK